MTNLIIALILAAVLLLAAMYVIKARKSGRKCIGCPDGACSQQCTKCTCGCGGNKDA